VHFIIKATEVLFAFGDIDHAFVATVEGCVKAPALGGRSAFHVHLAEHFVPSHERSLLQLLKVCCCQFILVVLFCLLLAYKRYGIPELDGVRAGCTKGQGGFTATSFPSQAAGDIESAIQIDTDVIVVGLITLKGKGIYLLQFISALVEYIESEYFFSFAPKGEAVDTGLLTGHKGYFDVIVHQLGFVIPGTVYFQVVVKGHFMVPGGGPGLSVDWLDGKHLPEAVRYDQQRESADLVVHIIGPDGIHAHYLVWQLHCWPGGLQQPSCIADGRIDPGEITAMLCMQTCRQQATQQKNDA
jgi:hypothetical protein